MQVVKDVTYCNHLLPKGCHKFAYNISTLRYNYCTCKCWMMWIHSPQSPKISTTQHECSFSFISKISSQVRGSELHWVSSRIGAQKTAFAFVMALALSMPWLQIQHEQGHSQHLKNKVSITTCCMLSVWCELCYLLAAHFWWCESQKVWLSLHMLPGSVGQKCQLLPPSALLELGGCDFAHLAGSHSWQCETTLP